MRSDAPTLYPLMRFRDAPGAIAFLKTAFDFRERQVIANEDGTIAHAELSYGPSILMLGSDRDDPVMGSRAGHGWIYVAVANADEHLRPRACGRLRPQEYDPVHLKPVASSRPKADLSNRD